MRLCPIRTVARSGWRSIKVWANCPAPPSVILFPAWESNLPARVVLRCVGSSKIVIATTGKRPTEAEGACVDPSLFSNLGASGDHADARYHQASLLDVLVHNADFRLSALVAVLSIMSGLAAAELALTQAQPLWWLPVAVFLINGLAAIFKAMQDYVKL